MCHGGLNQLLACTHTARAGVDHHVLNPGAHAGGDSESGQGEHTQDGACLNLVAVGSDDGLVRAENEQVDTVLVYQGLGLLGGEGLGAAAQLRD